MMTSSSKDLLSLFSGYPDIQNAIRLQEPLASYTTWKIGGKAEYYFTPKSLGDLEFFLSKLPREIPLTWLGLGSNVLIRDSGIRGVVIHTHAALKEINFLKPIDDESVESILRVEAGVPCAKVAKWCAFHGLSGGAFLAGIPGTIGGALAMNAGAFGGETWDSVFIAEVISRNGERSFRKKDFYQVGYRSVINPKEEWFIAGHFQFKADQTGNEGERIKNFLKQRNKSQPIGSFSCGSVFKNPDQNFAAYLIEASKLKGRRIGDAEVSKKHANFILNLGKATSDDVEALIAEIIETVFKDHGVILSPEVRILGS